MLTSVRIRSRSTASSGSCGGRVGPLLELLHDPGEQPGGGVGQRLPDGLRPGALDLHVRAGLLLPLLHRGQPGALGLGQRGHLGRVAGGEGDQRVDVHADDPAGSHPADERGDEGAHVPALHAVAVVAEPVHQLGQRGGGAAVRPAGLGQRTGESVAGQRRDDQVEGVGGVAAVRGRIGERADQVEELHDRARPAVQEQQRGGVRLGGAQVQEVHAGPVDRGDELGEGVERRLVGPPVVLLGPVVGELTQVAGRNAALPAGAGQVAGPAGPGQPLAEVVDVGLRDADAVRPDPGVGGGAVLSVCCEVMSLLVMYLKVGTIGVSFWHQ